MLDDHLVCFYIDDTGQKTKGRYFLIAGVAIEGNRQHISRALEDAETNSDKRKRDWHHSDRERRIDYLERVASIEHLRDRVFYSVHHNTRPARFGTLRADAVQAAIIDYAAKHHRAVHYEGLTRPNQENLRHDAHSSHRDQSVHAIVITGTTAS